MADDLHDLRTLFSSLSELAQLGPLPVQAYSMIAQRHSPEALAEHLHQRWMADARFAPVAASIILHIHRTEEKGMGLSSCVLALLLNDYRSRLEVRAKSTLMFRNCVKTLFAMYPVYEQIDQCVSKCFVKPMFSSLDLLIDNSPELDDIETVGVLLTEHGYKLNGLNSYRLDSLVVKVRARLCEEGISPDIRRILLHVNDLWAFGWSELLIPDSLTMTYKQIRDEEPTRKEIIEKKEFGSKESIV